MIITFIYLLSSNLQKLSSEKQQGKDS